MAVNQRLLQALMDRHIAAALPATTRRDPITRAPGLLEQWQQQFPYQPGRPEMGFDPEAAQANIVPGLVERGMDVRTMIEEPVETGVGLAELAKGALQVAGAAPAMAVGSRRAREAARRRLEDNPVAMMLQGGIREMRDLVGEKGVMGALGSMANRPVDVAEMMLGVMPGGAVPAAAKAAKAKSLFDVRPRVTKESLENPAVWRREGLREEGATTVEDQLPIERNVVQPEDLQGKVGIPFMGDRSRAGGQLTQVEGVPLSRPVALQGGEDYPLVTNPDAAWASNLGAARSRQNVAERALEETGQAPVGGFTDMGERGIDFSTPVIEAMMGQLEAIRVPKKAIAKFDRRINDKIKTINEFNERPMQKFVGLNHPDAMAQILGVGDYPSVGAGELRKLLVQEMGMTEFRDIGFPVYHDVMRAVTKPELMPLQRGAAGTTMLRLDPEAPLSPESRHRTYTTAIPGGYLGGLEEAVPAKVMYPKGYEQMAGMKTKTGKPLSESDKIGWLGMSQHWEVFDQEWVDKVSEWLQSSEAKTGGAAMILAPLVFGAAQLEQLEQE